MQIIVVLLLSVDRKVEIKIHQRQTSFVHKIKQHLGRIYLF